jgi:hypothetical protein
MTKKTLLRKVRKIATTSRTWAEKKSPQNLDLAGMCAISSRHLYKELRRAGITAYLACNGGHCFVLLGKDMKVAVVVDVTATQFDEHYPKVMIRKLSTLQARDLPNFDVFYTSYTRRTCWAWGSYIFK